MCVWGGEGEEISREVRMCVTCTHTHAHTLTLTVAHFLLCTLYLLCTFFPLPSPLPSSHLTQGLSNFVQEYSDVCAKVVKGTTSAAKRKPSYRRNRYQNVRLPASKSMENAKE